MNQTVTNNWHFLFFFMIVNMPSSLSLGNHGTLAYAILLTELQIGLHFKDSACFRVVGDVVTMQ